MYFSNKKVLVTGAARGIGKAIAESLSKQGACLILVDIDEAAVRLVAEEIIQSGGNAQAFTCNISKSEQVSSLYQAVTVRVGVPDILINNAYARHLARGEIDNFELGTFQQAFDINTLGPLRIIQAFLPAMKKRGNTHIVDTSSSLVISPNPDARKMLPYMASKGAILGLAYALRYSLADNGIRYSLFCPGLTDTRPPDQAPIADFPDNAAPASHAAKVLLEGIKRGDFLISSEPDIESKLIKLATQRLDPLA